MHAAQDKRHIHYYDSVLIIIFYGSKKGSLSHTQCSAPRISMRCRTDFQNNYNTSHLHVWCNAMWLWLHWTVLGNIRLKYHPAKVATNSSSFYSSKKVIILSDPIRLAFVLLPRRFIRHSRCDNFVFLFLFFSLFRWFVFRRVVLFFFFFVFYLTVFFVSLILCVCRLVWSMVGMQMALCDSDYPRRFV